MSQDQTPTVKVRMVEEVVTTFELPAGWLAAHGYPTTPAEVQRILSDGNLGTDELFEALDHDRENLSQDVAVTERDFSVDDVEPSELCSECQELRRCAELADAGTDPLRDMPTRWWHCQECGEHLERWRGQGDQSCECGAEYNASGQRLRDDWRSNASLYDDDIDDLTGFELGQLRQEGDL